MREGGREGDKGGREGDKGGREGDKGGRETREGDKGGRDMREGGTSVNQCYITVGTFTRRGLGFTAVTLRSRCIGLKY
jgi:hypothetical protein